MTLSHYDYDHLKTQSQNYEDYQSWFKFVDYDSDDFKRLPPYCTLPCYVFISLYEEIQMQIS